MIALAPRSLRLAMLVVVIASTRAFADIGVAESVERLVADADLVVRCRLVSRPPVDFDASPAVLEISETFKGPLMSGVTVSTTRENDLDFDQWLAEGGERICFFVRSERRGVERNAEAKRPNLYPFAIRERSWQFGKSWQSPARETIAFTSDSRVLRTSEQIEAAVRTAAAEEQGAALPPGELWTEPRMPSFLKNDPLAVVLWDASWEVGAELTNNRDAALLVVPLDSRIERLARTWLGSSDRNLHANAVGVLSHVKNERNVALLRAELADVDFGNVVAGSGPAARWSYRNRQVAFDALRRWGIDVPRPAIDLPADGCHAITFSQAAIALAGGAVAWVSVATAAHAIRRRREHGGATPAGRRLRDAIVDATCVALSIAGVLFAVADVQSVATEREVALRFGTARGWVFVYAHGLGVAIASPWDERDPSAAPPLAIGSFDVTPAVATRWQSPIWNATTAHAFHGFGRSTGTCAPTIRTSGYAGPGKATPYSIVRVPLWCAAIALFFVPLTRVGAAALRAMRGRSRRRAGQCFGCGYDLRGGRGERCPECGRMTTERPTLSWADRSMRRSFSELTDA